MNKETILLNNIFNYKDDRPEETLEHLKRIGINPDDLIQKSLEFLDKIKTDSKAHTKACCSIDRERK